LGVWFAPAIHRELAVFKQSLIPGFPAGAQRIGESLSILERDGQVIYFVGGDNYFSHPQDDVKSRRFVLASLMENSHVRAIDLEGAPLLIPHRTLMNWVAQYRKEGSASFFRNAPVARPSVMSAEMSAQCARLLAEGLRPSDVARRVGIQESTLRKALKRQAVAVLPESAEPNGGQVAGSTKAERSRDDAQAASGMGTACTRADERVAAAVGLAQCATTRFEPGQDVQMAGLLTGLPALCANGLLSGLGRYLRLAPGFYSALHILVVLGFMALGRIRRPEGLRHIPPGEFGKVIGLDRVPEVRTLREKIAVMAATGEPGAWMKELSKSWMEGDPDEAGYLYVDGHVRVYNGELATLPRRFVSRERLCLRGTTDYWVNDAVGRPFFVVSKAVTEGLADALLKDIVPELLLSVPQQPTAAELDNDPQLHRFVMVFDREGATHSLLSQLWQQRIGALTYRKNVRDVWPEGEFIEQEVVAPGGGSTRMKLSMRQTTLSAGKASIPVTEVRRLTPSGHQTAVITTAQRLDPTLIASRMFSRWCQENFFAYMMQHYDIDGLIEYGVQSLPGTLRVVNPAWRKLDVAVKKARQAERRLQAQVARSTLDDGGEIQKKAESLEAMQAAQQELKQLRLERKETPRKVTIESLPEEQRPNELLPLGKMFCDTVKMIAYRAETAMVALLRRHLKNEAEARALIRDLLVASADIEPDAAANTLTIRIHRMANPAQDKAVAALLDDLSKQAFCHPETGAKMIYTLV
jgi:transposase-like protein